ncbi:Fc.00g002430.m01.CDS01 [Cosmosporella sp. VM-42]
MSLPLKAKIAVRDGWDKPDSPARKAINELHTLLGLEVRCEPDWSLLIAELDSAYDDKGQLINSAISCIETWFTTTAELLDDESHEEWVEKLLENLKESYSRLTLLVEVSESDKASTLWSDNRKGFTLYIPKTHIYQASQFISILKEQLLDCFEEKKETRPLPTHTITSHTGDEWADVVVEVASEKPILSSNPKPTIPEVEYLPDANALPKPGTLLLRPPYHLFIYAMGNSKMEIQCSHAPTLNLLSDYLKRWCRTNPHLTNKPPSLSIELNHATCCFGEYDTLTLHAENRYAGTWTASPTMILNIVEGVLGYERVFGDSNSWQYRKDTPFKKL